MDSKLLALYSKSPRRLELMQNVGIFDVIAAPSDFDEQRNPGEDVRDYVLRNARGKLASSKFKPGSNVERLAELAADTVVYYKGEVLEKPLNSNHAAEMLRNMSAGTHKVLTGVALRYSVPASTIIKEVVEDFIVETSVTLGSIDETSLGKYIASMDWKDKAGGYGIQGFIGSFVTSVSGSYHNVVGLPVAQVLESMRRHNFI